MMTKQRIEQYISLKHEIAMLEDQIYKAECSGEFVIDSVKASSHEIPYAVHNVTIKGYATCHVPKLHKRRGMREKECAEIEGYVEQLDDAVLRQIITWRYIDGKTVAETATLCGYSTRQVHRLINAFFEKMSSGVS